MADEPVPGRGLVTRRAVAEIARRAAVGSYGVVAVTGPRPWHTALAWIGRATPGVRARLGPPLRIDLYLGIARGVPIAEVARNVDDAVRYAIRRALDREVDDLAIHVDRLHAALVPRPAVDDGARSAAPESPAADPATHPESPSESMGR